MCATDDALLTTRDNVRAELADEAVPQDMVAVHRIPLSSPSPRQTHPAGRVRKRRHPPAALR